MNNSQTFFFFLISVISNSFFYNSKPEVTRTPPWSESCNFGFLCSGFSGPLSTLLPILLNTPITLVTVSWLPFFLSFHSSTVPARPITCDHREFHLVTLPQCNLCGSPTSSRKSLYSDQRRADTFFNPILLLISYSNFL